MVIDFFKKVIHKLEYWSTGYKKLQTIEHTLLEDRKNAKINIGQLQASANKNKLNITSLAEVEFQVFSQFGDDGIIQWLIHFLPLPNKTFIEFGVENYRESNTRFLLINNYWSGLVIDGSEQNVMQIKNEQIHTFYDLQAVCSFITAENINELILSAGFEKEVGILSVDIDGNDYWVWKNIQVINPVIVICEYNALYGFEPYTIPYEADFVRGKVQPPGFFGASLQSFTDLAKEKGYTFIGCNSAGNNSYFIRNDYLHHLPIEPCTVKDGYRFSNFTESYSSEKNEWLRGGDKIRPIDGAPVFNTRTETVEKLDTARIIQSLRDAKMIRRNY